jgi:hypothetical protein
MSRFESTRVYREATLIDALHQSYEKPGQLQALTLGPCGTPVAQCIRNKENVK